MNRKTTETTNKIRHARELSDTKGGRDSICTMLGMNGENGRYWCPICQTGEEHKTPDLSIEAGFQCHKCGWSGDGIKLVREVRGIDFLAAVNFLVSDTALVAHTAQQTNDTPKVYPSLEKAVSAMEYGFKQGEFSLADSFYYRIPPDGYTPFVVLRFEHPAKGKSFCQLHQVKEGWKKGLPEEQRILYNLDKLEAKSDETVFVVEGEKCADALCNNGLLAVTSVCGSKSADKTDWSPLRGRRVIVIPDNDESGERYAADVQRLVRDSSVLRLEGLNLGEDVADWLLAGHSAGELQTLAEGSEQKKTGKNKPLNYYIVTQKDSSGRRKSEKHPLPYDKTISNIERLVQDRIIAVGPMIFAIPESPGDRFLSIKNAADLFAWLGVVNRSPINWMNIQAGMTKAEAFSQIAARAKSYRGIESVPHNPAMEGIYYNHPPLPTPDHEALISLINRFAPETKFDQVLILAMFVTALWGGPEGQRPAFVITSKDGRGVGKTTIPESVARLLSQEAISSSSKADIEQLKTRLLSAFGLQTRIVIFDNETGRVSNGELAGLITARTISGKALYVGEGRRPNNLLWCITLNTPSLDSDIACRSIPIAIKRPEQDGRWLSDTMELIEKHRWGIISALVDILKTETTPLGKTSRWGAWEDGVLVKLRQYADIDELRDLINERQRSFDDEADEIGLILEGFMGCIEANYGTPEMGIYLFPNDLAAKIYFDATGAHGRKNTALRAIKDLIRTESLPGFDMGRCGSARGFIYTGDNASIDCKMEILTKLNKYES